MADLDEVQRPTRAAAGGEQRDPLVAGQNQVIDFVGFQQRRLQQHADLAVAEPRIQGDDFAGR